MAALEGDRRQACGRRRSVVADGPLEADALLALEEALRVQLGLDRLEPREAVRAPDVLLHGDALLFAFRVRKTARTKRRVVGLERTERVAGDMVIFRASEEFAFRERRGLEGRRRRAEAAAVRARERDGRERGRAADRDDDLERESAPRFQRRFGCRGVR